MKTLFVDDDPLLLQSMRRAFFGCGWSIATANNGNEALALLAEQRYDIVVSDVRMPGISGIVLFEQIKLRYPQTLRIVLSTQPSRQTSTVTSMVAHHWLDKPCNIQQLKNTLERAYGNLQQIDSLAIKSLIGHTCALPSPPQIFNQIRLCFENSSGGLTPLIGSDPSLSAKILHVANASSSSHHKPINRISEAINHLGRESIYQIVLLAERHSLNYRNQHSQLQKLQQHACACAQLAQQIAPVAHKPEAMLAGLLHRLGDTLLINCRCRKHEQQPTAIVQHLGSQLLQLWGFPSTIIEAVQHCRQPSPALSSLDNPDKLSIGDTIYIADALLTDGYLDRNLLDQPLISPQLKRWQQYSQILKPERDSIPEQQGAAYES